MKKLIAAFLSLCLMLSAVAAFAGEAGGSAARKVSWSEFEAQAAQDGGRFMPISQTGLKIFIPSSLKEAPIPEEEQQKGIVLVLKSDSDEKVIVNAQYMPIDIDSFKVLLAQQGVVNISDMEMNGLPFSQFALTTDGAVTVCFFTSPAEGKVLTLSFTPASQAPYTELFRMMAASIQAA